MNTHTLLNVTDMITMLETGRESELKVSLQALTQSENRENVLGDQEMILGTASLLNEIAMNENKMSDKMCRIFWNRTKVILESKGIL